MNKTPPSAVEDVRPQIARLPDADSAEHVAILIAALGSPHAEVRQIAAKLLGNLDVRERPRLEALLAGLRHDNPRIRSLLVRVIAALPSRPAKFDGALRQLEGDPDPDVRAAVSELLRPAPQP